MNVWLNPTTTPPAAHDDVLVVYAPTAGGAPRVDIAFLLHSGEWRLSHSQLRIRPMLWQCKPEIPDTLEAVA